MQPIHFPGTNAVYAKNQPEYRELPAHFSIVSGRVTSCWQLTLRERLVLLCTGRLWFQQLTFGDRLQPQLPLVKRPLLEEPA